MPRDFADMTRAQLVAALNDLQQKLDRDSELRHLVEELSVHQEELQQQQEQLVDAQQALETSRDRFAELFDFAPIGYVSLDTQGLVAEANIAACQLLSATPAELRRSPMIRWVAELHRRAFADQLVRARRTGELVRSELVLGDGTAIELAMKLIRGEQSDSRLLCALSDLTARRRAEEDRFRAEQERQRLLTETASARAANEAKDRFLAILSHELRTPLTGLLLGVEVLEQRGGFPASLASTLDMMRRNVKLEARLIDDLLDVTRIVQGKLRLELETLDLHQLIADVASMCRLELDGLEQQLQFDLGAVRHHVYGDPTRLRQIVWNLLQNAIRVTPRRGRIALCTSDEPDDRIGFSVEDGGPGIPPEDLDRIFAPFEQAGADDGRSGRLGLGLAIARGLVAGHDGTVHAANTGFGARFEVRLPVADASHFSAPIAQRAARASAPLTILLVEDDPGTAYALSVFLTGAGYVVKVAGTVADAEALARQGFDVLLSDLRLPDGSGIDLMASLSKRGAVRAIAMSGFGSEEDIEQTRRVGFERHLVKPISGKEVVAEIERLVHR